MQNAGTDVPFVSQYICQEDFKSQVEKGLYEQVSIDSLYLDLQANDFEQALIKQYRLIKKKKFRRNFQLGELQVNNLDLEKVVKILLTSQFNGYAETAGKLSAYQIAGPDNSGLVDMTGYYTPLIEASKTRQGEFKYPLYAKPKKYRDTFPTRAQIDGDEVLKGMDLELAYTTDPVNIYMMQTQGSGVVKYRDGAYKYLAYDGTNKHTFKPIQSILVNEKHPVRDLTVSGMHRFFNRNPHLQDSIFYQNESYTFFKSSSATEPYGAGGVGLSAIYSVAVDPAYIPLGSCLVIALPITGAQGQLSHYEYRLAVAQDTGGSIKGPGRMDIYCGVGKEAEMLTHNLHHPGKVWLLLPKH